jgi:ATP-dependent DNA helicase RecG
LQSFIYQPIEYVKGIGPIKADLLKKELAIFNVLDLIQHFPFRYLDRTNFSSIAAINSDDINYQLKGKIKGFNIVGQQGAKRLVALFSDGESTIELVWFKGISWIEKYLQINQEYIVYGKPQLFNSRFNFSHPDIDLVSDLNLDNHIGLYPVYNTTEKLKFKGLNSRTIARIQKSVLNMLMPSDVAENLPNYLLLQFKLESRWQAINKVHFPKNITENNEAIRRLKFEELFFSQLQIAQLKVGKQKLASSFIFDKLGQYFTPFYNSYLPFTLTNAQKRVLKEIRKDLVIGVQMNRLIQGDVGSGKTIVALMSMLMAIDNGFQTCLMAPTEILAQQHFETISNLILPLNIKCALLTGSTKAKLKKVVLEETLNGSIDILIGTHALIEQTVQFKNIGLAVVDEQHKFGVAQRATLWTKNVKPPHMLVMTATPIPRTLAMTIYGDLDCSIIDELPPGRQPIATIHKTDSNRLEVFGFIKKEIQKGRQIYIVYPLIEESATKDYKDLMDGYESISRAFPLPDYTLSIVHGRQKASDKAYEMQRFVNGETNIMIATTVIEVGVNVPNASVMIIESAERFGLSQLHQLRGRVGRGAEKSYCILMTGKKISSDGRLRMKTLCESNDGFYIAEKDLEIRGPGDMAGTQQSGVINFKLANIAKDKAILDAARNSALEIIANDNELKNEENKLLNNFLKENQKSKNNWSRIS